LLAVVGISSTMTWKTAVIDAREELAAELSRAPEDVRDFIAEEIREWLGDGSFLESLAGHLAGDAASQARRPILLARLQQIASLIQRAGTPHAASPRPPVTALRPLTTASRSPPASMFGGPIRGAPSVLPERVQLRSTALREAAYDSQTRVLAITFRSGKVYRYSDVPRNVYAGLVQAGSHGRYFNQWIKGRY
jgi:hypothetical protein